MDIELLENQYAELRQAFDEGQLDADSFQVAVDELRTQDEYGRYWMIGAESGVWYYFDGVNWEQADPVDVDSLPFIDEDGVYWMLGQETNEWYYYDGENWVRPDQVPDESEYAAAEYAAADYAAVEYAQEEADNTEYYQDDQGRYWAIGGKSGEWYYYDDLGWHRATEYDLPTSMPQGQPYPQQPYQQPNPQTVPFQPQPSYSHSQPGPDVTQPVSPQYPYGPPAPGTPADYNQPPQQPEDPYAYAQPVPPQQQPQQPQQPYSEPNQGESHPFVPQGQQAPRDQSEPGVWMYYDGQQWLRYSEDPNAPAPTADGDVDPAFSDDVFAETGDFVDAEAVEDEQVIEIDDLDDFVEVVEVDEDDIIHVDEDDESTVEAEFEVEVLRPGEEPAAVEKEAPSEEAPQPAEAVSAEVATPAKHQTGAAKPVAAKAEAVEAVPQTAAQPQRERPEFSAGVVPSWIWTSLTGTFVLVAVALLLIGVLITLNNREDAVAVTLAQETPTLPAGAAPVTPTAAPTPTPSATTPPTPTAVPLATFNSNPLGFSIDYPSGWAFREDDDLVIFAPSSRSLDETAVNGASLWVSSSDENDLTRLLADNLERFSPISETLNEGTMRIGNEAWATAQIQFDSDELGGEGIALVASTIRGDTGYTLVAVAPAAEWEDFIQLFQYAVDSFAFDSGAEELLAQAPTEAAEEEAEESGDAGDEEESETATQTPEPTATEEETEAESEADDEAAEPIVYEVVTGDTIGDIALLFDVEIADILAANGLNENSVLSIGQELLIPQGSGTVALAPTATPGDDESDDEDESASDEDIAATPTTAATAAPTAVPQAQVSGRIAYPAYSTDIKSFNVWLSNVDGSNPQIVAENASQPKFSADGSLFAYRSWEPSNRGIFYRNLSNGSGDLIRSLIEDALPTWTSDGTVIFSSRREGDRIPRIFRTGLRPENRGGESLGFISEHLDVLSDGRLIARGCTVSGDCGLFTLAPDGSGEQKISNDTSDTAPAAHPQGGPIAMMSFDREGATNWEIWTINPDGSNARRLTDNSANDGLPTWSPDGRSIAFVSDRGGIWAVWVMNSDGSNQRKLFDMRGSPQGEVLHDVPNSKGWLEERIDWIP